MPERRDEVSVFSAVIYIGLCICVSKHWSKGVGVTYVIYRGQDQLVSGIKSRYLPVMLQLTGK